MSSERSQGAGGGGGPEQLVRMLARVRELIRAGQLHAAWESCADILRQYPEDADGYLLAGQIQFLAQRPRIAEQYLSKAVQLRQDSPDAQHLLSVVLHRLGQADRAIQAARHAHQLVPANAEICSNLGALITNTGSFNEAEDLLVRAGQLDSQRAVTFDNLGNLYRKQLRHAESLEAYRKAVALEPENAWYRMHAIKALDCGPGYPASDVFKFCKETGDLVQRLCPVLFDDYEPAGERLRLGYVGSTLRRHSVTYFLLPILASNNGRFEIFSYNTGQKEDEVTRRIAELSDGYRSLHGQSADAAARRIHGDGINILFDLDGYTEPGALQLLSHKPAPVQIAWIGCPGTTGMSRVDYRIVDDMTDPSGGVADSIHAEKLVRMPDCFSVYSSPDGSPDVSKTPAIDNGHITFGSFNVPIKMNPEVIDVWSRILRAVPNSNLVLKHAFLGQPSMRENVVTAFSGYGISADRLIIMGFDANPGEHLRRYHDIDVALDPFPYNGTTTTCDALWMGVPVVTLAGDRHVSRVGISLLGNVGHPELVAESTAEYVTIASDLADDIERLNGMRSALRNEMSDSPLMNAREFTTHLESTLEAIWRDHCESKRD